MTAQQIHDRIEHFLSAHKSSLIFKVQLPAMIFRPIFSAVVKKPVRYEQSVQLQNSFGLGWFFDEEGTKTFAS